MKRRKKQSSPSKYGEAFKRQIVSEFESGLSSKATLKRKYSISGHSCVDRWLEK